MEQDFNFNMRQVAHYCLEILNDLLKSFGLLMSRDLASIQSGILPMLSSPVPATRKRVATCVASLAICAPEQLFVTLVGAIFTNIEAARNADQIRTYRAPLHDVLRRQEVSGADIVFFHINHAIVLPQLNAMFLRRMWKCSKIACKPSSHLS